MSDLKCKGNEVIRRIIGKCVTRVAKQDVINASGAMQVCAGQKSGGKPQYMPCAIFLKPMKLMPPY